MILNWNSAIKVPVTLYDGSGNPKTGVAYGAVSVYLQKMGGAAVQKVLTAPDWTETSSTHMPGCYDLQLSSGDTDSLGILRFMVTTSGSPGYVGVYEVRGFNLDDVQSSLADTGNQILQRIGDPPFGGVEVRTLSIGQQTIYDAITSSGSDGVMNELANYVEPALRSWPGCRRAPAPRSSRARS